MNQEQMTIIGIPCFWKVCLRPLHLYKRHVFLYGFLFSLTKKSEEDFWFHLKDRASTHVIVKSNKQNLSDEVVLFASKLCVQFSTKSSGSYEVDYTKRQNVKIQNGAFVNYINYKTKVIKI